MEPQTSRRDDSALDNIVWHAIDGPQRALAQRHGLAGRFHPDVSPFSAVADFASAQAWHDLGTLVDPGHATVLFAPKIEVPEGWKLELRRPCLQMLAPKVIDPPPPITLTDLGPQDVPEMIELVAATRPGPFDQRTIELGRYIGLRQDGRLVAMAGERFKIRGYTEISAVCTVEGSRGKGLAKSLVLAMVEHISASGQEAMLHVETHNVAAIALYEKLGFTVRSEAEAAIVRNTRSD